MVYILELNRILKPLFNGFNMKKRMLMFMEMERMLDAGISIYSMFTHMLERSANKERARVVKKIRDIVDAGGTISDGMTLFPEYFTEDDIRLMEVGESIGKIDKACNIIWTKYEKQLEIRSKVILAAWYPVTLALIVPFILPIKYLFLVGPEEYFRHSLYPEIAVIIGIIVFFFAYRLFRVTPGIKETIDSTILALPFFGKINRKFSTARFATTFAMLYSGGIRLDENLTLSAQVSRNALLERDVKRIIPNITERGQSLTTELDSIGHFPPQVIELLSVGEETGKLDETLQKVSQYALSEADQALQRFARILPIFLFLIVAAIIGYQVVTMYLDIYNSIFEKARSIH